MSKTTYPEYVKSETQREAFDILKGRLKPGQTVYTGLNTVSRSGMSRNISVYIVEGGRIRDISWLVNTLNGKAIPAQGGVKMGGCGMDMGFALVYGLSSTLWHGGYRCNGSTGFTPTGKKSKRPRCKSNDHMNGEPLKAGMRHRDGGYALNQEWM